jgi:hypothetical protein
MGDLESKWDLLQFSLLRIDSLLLSLNSSFLEKGSYSISKEEREKLKAVIAIYRNIHEAVESETEHPVLVMDSLTEQMTIIYDRYADILEQLKDS